MKLFRWHTLVLRCPCCGKDADYAAQIVEGEHKGTYWNPSYLCEQCSTVLRARDTWIFGAAFGPLMAMVGTFAVEAIPGSWALAQAPTLAFAALCCGVVGWPLSRTLSKYLLYWEPRDPVALQRVRIRRLQDDEE